jgi:hypothetical protein
MRTLVEIGGGCQETCTSIDMRSLVGQGCEPQPLHPGNSAQVCSTTHMTQPFGWPSSGMNPGNAARLVEGFAAAMAPVSHLGCRSTVMWTEPFKSVDGGVEASPGTSRDIDCQTLQAVGAHPLRTVWQISVRPAACLCQHRLGSVFGSPVSTPAGCGHCD